MNAGKHRSEAQKIGEVGEALFTYVALSQLGLTVNRAERDYGIDAFCQVLGEGTPEPVLGSIIACQVKTVEGRATRRARIRIERDDAKNLLDCEQVVCLIGVHLAKSQVHYRFLDQTFADQIIEFLSSSRSSMTIKIEDLDIDKDVFRRTLEQLSRPGRQQRLRIHIQQRQLEAAAPGSHFEVRADADASYGFISTPSLGQLMDVEPTKLQDVRVAVFEKGNPPTPKIPGIRAKSVLDGIARVVDGSILLQAGVEEPITLQVESEGRTYSARFVTRRVGDERAWVHPAGIALIISDARRRDGFAFHDMDTLLFTGNAIPVNDLRKEKAFFRALRPGARLNEAGREGIPVEHWPGLCQIGPAIDAVQKVDSHLKLRGIPWYIGQLQEQEFACSLGFLEMALTERKEFQKMFEGFLLGPLAEDPDLVEYTPLFRGEVPVIVNYRDRGFIVWFRVKCRVQVYDDRICGVRFEWGKLHRFETRDSLFVKGPDPELIMAANWPSIPIGQSVESITWLGSRPPEYAEIEAHLERVGASAQD